MHDDVNEIESIIVSIDEENKIANIKLNDEKGNSCHLEGILVLEIVF